MGYLKRAGFFATMAAVLVATTTPASATVSKSGGPWSDGGFTLNLRVIEHNGGDFYAEATPQNDSAGNTTRTFTVVIMQCDGTGANCSVRHSNGPSYATYTGWAALITTSDDTAASFGHTYKACGSISGTGILSVCTPLLAYTTA